MHVHAYVPGQTIGWTHLPLYTTCPSGQKQPPAHPLWQFDVSVVSHVRGHNDPHCWYTIPGGHSTDSIALSK